MSVTENVNESRTNIRQRTHRYDIQVEWTGNTGTGTCGYRDYKREHEIKASEKDSIHGSADPLFRGDKARWNPEELLVSALSACHMLAYLHLCADAGVIVLAYSDAAEGYMSESANSSGQFTEVILRPSVTLAPGSDSEIAKRLHHDAHEKCFIANSVNFPVRCEPAIVA